MIGGFQVDLSWVLFTSEGSLEQEIDRPIGAASVILWTLYWSVVVKRELS